MSTSTPVYSPIPGHPNVTAVLSLTGVETRPITPLELESLRGIRAAADEAEEANGTAAFFTLAQAWHTRCAAHLNTFGVDPRPALTDAEASL